MKPFLWVIHCPRTGGTSVKAHCRDLVSRNLIGYEETSHSKYTDARRNQLEAKFGTVRAITVLRDPVQHMLSLYSYYLADRANPDHARAKRMPFLKWMDEYEHINYYVSYYGSGNIVEAEKVLKKFDHLLKLETLKDDFNGVLISLGLEANFNRHEHKHDIHRYRATPEEISKLRQVRSKDYELLSRLGISYG